MDPHITKSKSITMITDTRPEHWKYISEGGATMVFSYTGPPNSQFDGMALRLRKSADADVDEAMDVMDFLRARPAPNVDVDDPIIEYQHTCMERLIPREHLTRLESVQLDREWLKSLAALCHSDRTVARSDKDGIDTSKQKGVLATDLVGGDGLSVEIKPKWAFLPSLTHLSPSTRPIKTKTCRFCMHSHMKSKQDQMVASGYCPLDLFSPQESRVIKAVQDLWDAWYESQGTVNNLKIFVHGKLVKPLDDPSLLASDLSQDTNAEMIDLRASFVGAIVPLLMNTPVLHILSKHQRALDALDIEGLSKLWHRVHSGTQDSSTLGTGSNLSNPSINDWSEFLDVYLSSHANLDHTAPAPENLHYYLLAYLLSATFKDCSIIIRLNKDTSRVSPLPPNTVTVIDLDLKSADRLSKWELLDRKITESYSGVPEEEARHCIDDGLVLE